MTPYTDEERQVALMELRICLAVVNHTRAEWREPGDCADQIARMLQSRYEKLRALSGDLSGPAESFLKMEGI